MFQKNLVFAAACLGMLLFGIAFLSLGALNNTIAERFHLPANEIGTLTALLPLGILFGSIVFGPIVDRFGYKWMLVISALLSGAGLEGMAFGQSKVAIRVFVFLIGFGGGVLNGATNALTADVSEGERGARLSLLGVFFGIGALGMPGALALLSRSFSMTAIVAGIGAFVFLPTVYFLVIQFPPPKRKTAKGLLEGLRLLWDPVFLFAAPALAIQSGMEGMSNDWMTRYFQKVTLAAGNAAEWKTQLGLMAVTGAMVLARLCLSGLLKRVSSRAVLFASVATTAAGATLLMFANSYGVSLAAALFIGAGLAAVFPVVLGYIGDLKPSQSGAAFSVIFFIALIGNMTINKTFGEIAQKQGIQEYTTVMLACLAASALLLFLVTNEFKKHKLTLTNTNGQSCQTMAQ
ncbi:MAG: MFS transporter [Limisphaerales bacterium]